ncbi:MAG: glycosyltransferase family 4 protein [Acidobacteriota bacterium]
MRFLDVADFERDPNSGSAGSLLAIAAALAEHGHEVEHLWKQAKPYRLPHTSLSRWLELPRRQYRQVSDQLERRHYDVVTISQPYAYLAFERLPAKYPATLFLNMTHGWEDRFNAARLRFAWDGPYSPAKRLALEVTKSLVNRACVRTIRACHGFISPSQNSAQYVQRAYAVPEEKISVIPYGLDASFLRSEAARSASAGGVRMLYVGNYIVPKGSAVLESILPPLGLAFPHASLTFVTPGAEIDRIRARFEPAFGQRLTTLPWRDRNDLRSIYERHDVLLFPSLFEGFGKTFLEGMACGACVVGFNEGGLPDIAGNGAEALYCETGAVSQLRALLERCLQNPGLTREVGRRAQQVARQYSWPVAAGKLEAFCRQRRQAYGMVAATPDALVR